MSAAEACDSLSDKQRSGLPCGEPAETPCLNEEGRNFRSTDDQSGYIQIDFACRQILLFNVAKRSALNDSAHSCYARPYSRGDLSIFELPNGA